MPNKPPEGAAWVFVPAGLPNKPPVLWVVVLPKRPVPPDGWVAGALPKRLFVIPVGEM